MKITKIMAICGIVLTLSLFTGCNKVEQQKQPNHKLTVQGDIKSSISMEESWSNLELEEVTLKDGKAYGIDIGEFINSNKEDNREYDMYIVASDGFMVKLDGNTIADTHIYYTEDNGWCYISDKHPVNSRVKSIKEITVVNKSEEGLATISENSSEGFNIIVDETNNYYTKGELILKLNEEITVHDGVSVLDDMEIDVMKQKKGIKISNLIKEEIRAYTVVGGDGSMTYHKATDGYIFLEDSKINYMNLEHNSIVRDCYGIIVNPPTESVMDMYHDSTYFLGNKEKTMIIVVDGFSYHQYEYMKEKYPDMYLANIEETKKVTTVYRPVTNAGLAAMLTGTTPNENGVIDRDNREVLVPTIFDFCNKNNIQNVAIEGEVGILDLNTDVRLNISMDKDINVDEVIYKDTKQIVKNKAHDYIWTHFHSVDNCGHSYGPYGEETINQIRVVDGYIKELVSMWDGKVIILADHGMHDYDDAGSHGALRAEDMYVPYILTNGGLHE